MSTPMTSEVRLRRFMPEVPTQRNSWSDCNEIGYKSIAEKFIISLLKCGFAITPTHGASSEHLAFYLKQAIDDEHTLCESMVARHE